jgi:pyruvate dehydrogenase E2 component (dihydrolipoamide acetyltransferase)
MPDNDFTYVLPSLGADMDEASLLEWKIKPGDRVKRGQVVAVLETVKAAIDAEIWVDGVVEELLVQPDKDRKIKVGAPLARLKTDKPVEQPGATAVLPAPTSLPSRIDSPLPASPRMRGEVPGRAEGGRTLISPAARRRMQELGLSEGDLSPLDRPYGIADIEAICVAAVESQVSSKGPTTMRGADR